MYLEVESKDYHTKFELMIYYVQQICDVGSGKGYLGTQLSFQHQIPVLGIDAANINTSGAVKRSKMLQKQWNGLINNARNKKKNSAQSVNKNNTKILEINSARRDEQTSDHRTYHTQSSGQTCGKDRLKMISENSLANVSFTDLEVLENQNSNISHDQSGQNNNEIHDEFNLVYHQHNPIKTLKCKCPKSSQSLNLENKTDITVACTCSYDKQVEGQKQQQDISGRCVCKVLEPVNREAKLMSTGEVCSEKDWRREKRPSLSFYVPVTLYLNSNTDLSGIVSKHFPSAIGSRSMTERLMLTGLHTCGSLGSSILKLFTENPSVHVLSYVSCCYHLMEEEFVDSPFQYDGKKIQSQFL